MGLFAALDTRMRLWTWGREGSAFPKLPTPSMDNVADCSVGERFVIACTMSGDVFIIGRSPTGHEDATPIRVDSPPLVRRVAACGATALLLASDGAVYGAGAALTNGCGVATTAWRRLSLPPCAAITLGSRNGAAVAADSGLWVWGDGLSGSLGLGKRVESAREPILVESFRELGLEVCAAACTRGQAAPKRAGPPVAAGQEGPRVHAVTADGALWIAGAAHKARLPDPPPSGLERTCARPLQAAAGRLRRLRAGPGTAMLRPGLWRAGQYAGPAGAVDPGPRV